MAEPIAPVGVTPRPSRFLGSIRARLIILASLAIAPLIIDRVLDVAKDRAERIAAAHRQARQLAARGVHEQDELLATTRAFLQVVAHSYPTFAGSREACNAFLTKLAAGLPWARGISVVDRAGIVVCSSNPGSIGLDISDRPHFREVLRAGEFVVSDYLPGRRLTGPNIFALLPQLADDGSIDAVAVSVMDISWISRLGATVTERSGAVMLLVDGAGTIITRHPDPGAWIGRSLKGHPLAYAMFARPEGSAIESGIDGVRRIYGFVQLPGTDVRLAVGLDEREVLQRVNNAMWVSYGYLAAISAIVLIGIWFGGERLFVKPLRDLAGIAARVGRGERLIRAQEAAWAAEFAPLTTALDDMAGQIAEREHGLIKAKDRLEELSRVDSLTQLANRRAFDTRLLAAWQQGAERGHPVALLMIDVDHFKLFNDHYGHVEGDDCLRRIGKLLKDVTTEKGDLPARYGGEEFALLMPGADVDDALATGERLRQAVERIAIANASSPNGQLTISVGVVSLIPGVAEDAEHLIEAADIALYAAKRRGRNTVVAHGAVVLAEAS